MLRRVISTWSAFARKIFACASCKKKEREERENPISARPSRRISRRAFLASAKRVVFPDVHSRFINCESTTYYIKKKKRITWSLRRDRVQGGGRRVIRKGRGGGGPEVGGKKGIIVCEGEIDYKIDETPSGSPTSSGSFCRKKSPVNFLR